jgi:hypothetical protein
MTLTDEQRHVLAVYDSGMIADLIAHPEYGLSRIKSGQAGGTARPGNGPDWLRWYSTGSGGIHGGEIGDPRITITYTQLVKWASSVPPEIRDKVAANRAESLAESHRTEGWCRCPWADKAPNEHSQPCSRYHPTEAEDNENLAQSLRINRCQRVLVGQAIWAKDSDQLDLFEVSAQ